MTKKSEKCYLDTNILIYYKLKQSPYHRESTLLIESYIMRGFQFYISPLIIDEFLNAITRAFRIYKRKINFDTLEKILREILTIPNLEIIMPSLTKQDQLKVVSYMKNFALRPRDAYHLLTMLTNNINYFATFDNDFAEVFKKKIVSKLKV